MSKKKDRNLRILLGKFCGTCIAAGYSCLGVTMAQVTIDPEMLEFCVRTDLNRNARRVMAISSPLRVLISNFEASNLSTNITIPDFPESPEKVRLLMHNGLLRNLGYENIMCGEIAFFLPVANESRQVIKIEMLKLERS